jgi:hypothetical protein
MRSSIIELLYIDNIYDRVNLTQVNYPEVDLNKLTVSDLLNEFNTTDRVKFLLEQYFLLHYLVYIRGCECSPMLGNFRNYLEVLINRIDPNSASNKTNHAVVLEGKQLLLSIKTKKSILDYTEYDLQKLDDILSFIHDDESTVYVRMISSEVIAPLKFLLTRKTDVDLSTIDNVQCLIPVGMFADHKLTIENYNKVDVHPSLSVQFKYLDNVQSYDPSLSRDYDYYAILNKTITKDQTLSVLNTDEQYLLDVMKFFVGFKFSIIDNTYLLPEIQATLNSSIEPYLKSSWTDYIKLHIIHLEHQCHTHHDSSFLDNRKVDKYLSLILSALIFRSQHSTGVNLDAVNFIHSLASYLNLIKEPVSQESLTISSEQYAFIEPSPIKQLLHSMVLKYNGMIHFDFTEKYRFLDEDDDQFDPDSSETPTYTISEQPVTPLEDTSEVNDTPDDINNPDESQNTIVDPTNTTEDSTDESTDNVMVDDVSNDANQENQEEDVGPLFEFIKDKCTLNELFYKRKIANTIHKILETNPKGLVKEQIKSLEYWYRKLLFLVDISSTKKFLKSVLKDYKFKNKSA